MNEVPVLSPNVLVSRQKGETERKLRVYGDFLFQYVSSISTHTHTHNTHIHTYTHICTHHTHHTHTYITHTPFIHTYKHRHFIINKLRIMGISESFLMLCARI